VVLDATKGGGEVAIGEVVSREEIREVVAEFIGGPGLGSFRAWKKQKCDGSRNGE
jgi:hypothetical protein